MIAVLPQVGASNELPESEELDALYDRFLIRRQVSPVSNFGLNAMLQAAADNNLAVSDLLYHTAHTETLVSAQAQMQHALVGTTRSMPVCVFTCEMYLYIPLPVLLYAWY